MTSEHPVNLNRLIKCHIRYWWGNKFQVKFPANYGHKIMRKCDWSEIAIINLAFFNVLFLVQILMLLSYFMFA